MRPRHRAAENLLAAIHQVRLLRASMRPRHRAAENRYDLQADIRMQERLQ